MCYRKSIPTTVTVCLINIKRPLQFRSHRITSWKGIIDWRDPIRRKREKEREREMDGETHPADASATETTNKSFKSDG